MARFLRRMQAPINTVKHYVGHPKFSVALGTKISLEITDVVPAPVNTTREKISEGSLIKSIHYEFWIVGGGLSDTFAQFVMTIEKISSGLADPSFADMLNLGGYKNKKNILYTTQGIIVAQADGAQAVPIIRDWLLIPKGKQRQGQGDRIVVTFATVEQALQVCGMTTYKEYQ